MMTRATGRRLSRTLQMYSHKEMVHVLKTILFSRTLRIYGLRSVVIFAACTLVLPAFILSPFSALVSLWILLHHIASTVKLKFFYEIIDWVLISWEISIWFLFGITHTKNRLDALMDSFTITSLVSVYILLVALFFLWLLRTVSILGSRGQNLIKPFDLFSGCRTVKWSPSPLPIIFGRSVWRKSTSGSRESTAIKIFRRAFAIGLFSILLLFSMYAMFTAPFREAAMSPVHNIYTSGVPYDIRMVVPVWTIVAMMNMDNLAARHVEDFKAAINVTPLWDDSSDFKPPCIHVPGDQTSHLGYDESFASSFAQTIKIHCPNRISNHLQVDPVEIWNAPTQMTYPDLLISVNYTTLGITESLFETHLRTVSILVGLTNNTDDVISFTLPTPLVSGLHLLGSVSMRLRQCFNKASQATLGLFPSSRTFLLGDISTLTPDPSPLIPRHENTATLRIYVQDDPSNFVFVEEYREKSVLGGFAAVGGFWTFINGAFAVIFGSSLMFILFGIKPLSVFGIMHSFQRGRLRAALNEDFPLIRTEGGLPGSERAGLVAFLRERLIDLEPIEEADDVESRALMGGMAGESVALVETNAVATSD